MCRAVVGLGRPEVFPEGAATGVWASRMTPRHRGWAGQRIPTVSSPAVTTSGITRGPKWVQEHTGPFFSSSSSWGVRFLHRRTMVSGPGQNRSASRYAVSGMSSQYRSSQSALQMWRIRGLSWGRPLAWKICPTAMGFIPSAPRPYTVSVGMPTRPPPFKIPAAFSASAGVRICVFILKSTPPAPVQSPRCSPPPRPPAPGGCGSPTALRS